MYSTKQSTFSIHAFHHTKRFSTHAGESVSYPKWEGGFVVASVLKDALGNKGESAVLVKAL